jgi:hypothetical protein
MDPKSPYHESYKISGIGVVDPKWWADTMTYLSSNGVSCYEQDWLDPIFANSPEMSTTLGIADEFTDGMANAAKARGMTLQYCMATPRFFLQGVKYPNLTTIRTSGDRFEPGKWADFLYCSQLAQGVGIWPWCDVFKSRETGNLILSVLSGGPVGTGDAIGKEDKDAILRAAMPDGVIVKPDRAILPCDETYLNEATGQPLPFLASTYTVHGDLRTEYLFDFRHKPTPASVGVFPIQRGGYLLDLVSGEGTSVNPGESVGVPIGPDGYGYAMLAPKSKCGIVLLGDLGKIVPTGKQRIPELRDEPGGLTVRVQFARGEGSVVLDGVSGKSPKIVTLRGSAKLVSDEPSGRFKIEVRASSAGVADFRLSQ